MRLDHTTISEFRRKNGDEPSASIAAHSYTSLTQTLMGSHPVYKRPETKADEGWTKLYFDFVRGPQTSLMETVQSSLTNAAT